MNPRRTPLRRHHHHHEGRLPAPDPADFAVAAEQAAATRGASGVITAHTAEQIISVVTVMAPSRPTAMAVALAVVSDTLKRPVRAAP